VDLGGRPVEARRRTRYVLPLTDGRRLLAPFGCVRRRRPGQLTGRIRARRRNAGREFVLALPGAGACGGCRSAG
jgi:hypothetical protein